MTEDKAIIAVVDDDENFARAIARLLRAAGLNSFVCPSAEAYLQDARRPKPDCLVLDIHLPGMSGLDLCHRLALLERAAPVILVTAHDEPQAREEAERAGCLAYFSKPVSGKVLLETINRALSRN